MLCKLIQNSSLALTGIQVRFLCHRSSVWLHSPVARFSCCWVSLQTQQSMIEWGRKSYKTPAFKYPTGCRACGESCRYWKYHCVIHISRHFVYDGLGYDSQCTSRLCLPQNKCDDTITQNWHVPLTANS